MGFIINDAMPDSFLRKGIDFLTRVQPYRVSKAGLIEAIEFSKVSMQRIGVGSDAYTLINCTRRESSSINVDDYKEIVIKYRSPQLFV
jgi:hypothetical protein